MMSQREIVISVCILYMVVPLFVVVSYVYDKPRRFRFLEERIDCSVQTKTLSVLLLTVSCNLIDCLLQI